jgi:hypothetical protein
VGGLFELRRGGDNHPRRRQDRGRGSRHRARHRPDHRALRGTTLLTQAQNGTAAEFAFAFTIDANRSLTFKLHEVHLALAKTPIEEASSSAPPTTPRPGMMSAVLKNQQAGPEYV